MPVHDWTRVDDGVFHTFHVDFIATLCRRLNGGLLPAGYYAASEQVGGRGIPDVLALREPDDDGEPPAGGLSAAVAPPRVAHHTRVDLTTVYLTKVNRVAVRRTNGDRVVAVIELVSAGNKSGQTAFNRFVGKLVEYVSRGVHVLVADYHPPTRRDPHGVHPAVWGELVESDYRPPADKPLTLAAYLADADPQAFVQPLGVGDVQPDMPLFLTTDRYIPVPLEAVYMDCWAAFPPRWQRVIELPADA